MNDDDKDAEVTKRVIAEMRRLLPQKLRDELAAEQRARVEAEFPRVAAELLRVLDDNQWLRATLSGLGPNAKFWLKEEFMRVLRETLVETP